MRTVVLLCVMLLGIGLPVVAEDAVQPSTAPEKVIVQTAVTPGEIRVYKVVVTVEGSVPRQSGDPLQIDTSYSLKLQHKYGSRDSDGTIPVEVSLLEGQQTVAGQTLTLGRNDFPKLTVLLDRDWHIERIYGITGSPYERSKPGLNYVNMLQLFFLYGGDKPHSIGEKWEIRSSVPLYQETYSFVNAIKAVEGVGDAKAASVQQDVTWTPRREADMPYSTVKASVSSSFAVANGKLLKSHADCAVSFWGFDKQSIGEQDHKPTMANIKLDISLAN